MLLAISLALLCTGAKTARLSAEEDSESDNKQESGSFASSQASCEWENGHEYKDLNYGNDHVNVGGDDVKDESNQKFDLYTTQAAFVDGAAPVPLAVYVHGGAWKHGKKFPLDGEFRALRQRGFHVASINYRLTSAQIIHPTHINDVELAIAFFKSKPFVKKFNINPEKIVAMGSSAGGHLVSLLGTRNPPGSQARVAAVVNFYGPTALLNKSPKQWDSMLGCQGAEKEGSECYKLCLEALPITYVSKSNPPFLNFVGTRDVSCDLIAAFQNAADSAGADYTTHNVTCSKATCHTMDAMFAGKTDEGICNVDVMYEWIYQKLHLSVAGCSTCPTFDADWQQR